MKNSCEGCSILEKGADIMEHLSKEERIKTEIDRITNLLADLGEGTLKGVRSLIENAAFMSITLEDLQKSINENGVISEYKNGENQFGTKKSPEVEVYNTMIKNHMSAIKQLTELIPKTNPNAERDELLDFLSGGKK